MQVTWPLVNPGGGPLEMLATDPGVQVVGLPEQAGVLVEDGALTAVGSAASAVLSDGGDLPVGSTRRLA